MTEEIHVDIKADELMDIEFDYKYGNVIEFYGKKGSSLIIWNDNGRRRVVLKKKQVAALRDFLNEFMPEDVGFPRACGDKPGKLELT
jgi:hypothetical protein